MNQGSILLSQTEIVNNNGFFTVRASNGSNQIIAESSRFYGNRKAIALGALISSQFIVSNSEFYDNYIGACTEFVHAAQIDHSLFRGNQWGVSIVGCGSQFLVENSTMANNALYGVTVRSFVTGADGDVIVRNATLANNKINLNYEKFDLGSYIDFSAANSVVDDNTCGTQGIIVADAQLSPLAMNGGDLATMLPSSRSPAVDAGNNLYCPETDQRFLPRPVNATKTGAQAICDIGAVELHP